MLFSGIQRRMDDPQFYADFYKLALEPGEPRATRDNVYNLFLHGPSMHLQQYLHAAKEVYYDCECITIRFENGSVLNIRHVERKQWDICKDLFRSKGFVEEKYGFDSRVFCVWKKPMVTQS